MPTYSYKAKNNKADTVSGQINAGNKEEALDLIHQLGLLPVEVEDGQESESAEPVGRRSRVSVKLVAGFSRQLSNLLKSGMPLPRALALLEQQTDHPYFQKVVRNILVDVKNGSALHEALREYREIFPDVFLSMVEAGEESDQLVPILAKLSEYLRRQDEMWRKVRNSLTYPLFMAMMGAATVWFILAFVLPRMRGLFESLGDNLPLPTRILLRTSDVLYQGWWIILIAFVVVVYLGMKWLRSEKGMKFLSRLLLGIPGVGPVMVKLDVSRFCLALKMLLSGGVSIVRALAVSSPVVKNSLIRDHLQRSREDIVAGASLGESLRECPQFPDIVGQMISVGEESGHLTEVLEELADSFEQEINDSIKTWMTLLEPVMILLVGVIVGFIVFSMLLPIFQIDVLSGVA